MTVTLRCTAPALLQRMRGTVTTSCGQLLCQLRRGQPCCLVLLYLYMCFTDNRSIFMSTMALGFLYSIVVAAV